MGLLYGDLLQYGNANHFSAISMSLHVCGKGADAATAVHGFRPARGEVARGENSRRAFSGTWLRGGGYPLQAKC
jgi:hypothetical protein